MGDRIAELSALLEKKNQIIQDHTQAFKVDGENVTVDPEVRDSLRKHLKDAQEIQGLLQDEKAAKGLIEWGKQPTAESIAVAQAAAAAGGSMRPQMKDLGSAFTESPQFKALLEGGGDRSAPFTFEGDLGSMWLPHLQQRAVDQARKDLYSTLPSADPITPQFGRILFDPLIPMAQRTQRVRDLFPARRTDAQMIEYIRQTGFTNAASPTPERVGSAFGLKPQSGLTFEVVTTTMKVIAHWEAASRTVLRNEPQLQAMINNELLYGLRLAEDAQILNGTGTGSDLEGILVTTGVLSHPQGSDTNIDAIRKAITLIELTYYEATGIVLHPTNWETVELSKETGTGAYILGGVASGAEKRLWRLPVITTPAMTVNTGLVGAFGLGAQLYDRMTGNVRTTESHSDWFIRNAIAILAEEELALTVKVPQSFCKVTGLD